MSMPDYCTNEDQLARPINNYLLKQVKDVIDRRHRSSKQPWVGWIGSNSLKKNPGEFISVNPEINNYYYREYVQDSSYTPIVIPPQIPGCAGCKKPFNPDGAISFLITDDYLIPLCKGVTCRKRVNLMPVFEKSFYYLKIADYPFLFKHKESFKVFRNDPKLSKTFGGKGWKNYLHFLSKNEILPKVKLPSNYKSTYNPSFKNVHLPMGPARGTTTAIWHPGADSAFWWLNIYDLSQGNLTNRSYYDKKPDRSNYFYVSEHVSCKVCGVQGTSSLYFMGFETSGRVKVACRDHRLATAGLKDGTIEAYSEAINKANIILEQGLENLKAKISS